MAQLISRENDSVTSETKFSFSFLDLLYTSTSKKKIPTGLEWGNLDRQSRFLKKIYRPDLQWAFIWKSGTNRFVLVRLKMYVLKWTFLNFKKSLFCSPIPSLMVYNFYASNSSYIILHNNVLYKNT